MSGSVRAARRVEPIRYDEPEWLAKPCFVVMDNNKQGCMATNKTGRSPPTMNEIFFSPTTTDHHHFCISTISLAIAMEQVRRKDLERTQLDMLSALHEYLNWNCRSFTSVDAAELEALGIVRWTDLDVDGQLPCDFEPLFFFSLP